jgi:hypothetical protein
MIRRSLIALALLALAGCSKPAPNAPGGTAAASAPAAAAGPAAAASVVRGADGSVQAHLEPPLADLGDFRIVSVLMGDTVDAEHVVVADNRQFDAGDAIYASVLSIGPHQGLKLSAEWLAPDGSAFARSEQAIVPTSDLATTFKVRNPAGWPSGDYQLRLAINGQAQRTEKFSVR